MIPFSFSKVSSVVSFPKRVSFSKSVSFSKCVFQEVSNVTGFVMTKLDGTAKGGVLVALADKFGLPIHAIGVGEQIDDLQAFDPKDFAKALTGSDA